jgi:predicted GTPase
MWTLEMGKGGVGESSTVNSQRVAVVSAFQSETTKAFQHARSRAGFTLNIINTLGLVEGGGLNDQDIALQGVI